MAMALRHLCSSGMAEELVLAIQAIRKLRTGSVASAHPAGTPAETQKKREDPVTRARAEHSRANVVLAEDLAYRTDRSEFHLRGRANPAEPATAPVVIPLKPARSLSIDPEANTITTPSGTYRDVEAVLGPPPPTVQGEMPRRLPLWNAVMLWCHPVILGDIRRLEGHFQQDELLDFEHPTLGAAGDGRATLRGEACPSSNALRQRRRLANGGSGASDFEVRRRVAGGSNGAVGWSAA
jgi:hypothetical protein